MQTSVTFKNLDPSDNLKTYVTDKLNRFDKLLDNPAEASVVLSVEKLSTTIISAIPACCAHATALMQSEIFPPSFFGQKTYPRDCFQVLDPRWQRS